ncbi:MAG: uracil-DNA glycosylase [Candidatus Acidiferrales bacterium]
MNDETRAKVEAWLRYYRDIGVKEFYRDRASGVVTEMLAAPRNETASGRIGLSPAEYMNFPSQPALLRVAAQPVSASAPPILQSASLFDAADRVEGDTLESIRADIGDCTRCRLHKSRTNIVFGVGNPKAELVFVGEGPGHDEDLQGIPFVGRAGKLLTQMIEAMGLRREDVYICNVVKCRPPENRLPERDEIATCSPFLMRQLGVIAPKVIVCLGACAAQTLLATNAGISKFRGQWFDFHGSKLMATYHPAYLLRNPPAKGEVWNDLKKVLTWLGREVPKRAAQR